MRCSPIPSSDPVFPRQMKRTAAWFQSASRVAWSNVLLFRDASQPVVDSLMGCYWYSTVAWAAPSGNTLYRGCTVDMHCMLYNGDIHELVQSIQYIVKLQQHGGSHLFRKPGLPFAWYWYILVPVQWTIFSSVSFFLAMAGRFQVIGTIVILDRTVEYLPPSGFCLLWKYCHFFE